MLLASTFLEALVPDRPGAAGEALFPTEEYTLPDTAKDLLPRIRLQDYLSSFNQHIRVSKLARHRLQQVGQIDFAFGAKFAKT